MIKVVAIFVVGVASALHNAPAWAGKLVLPSMERHGTIHQSACTEGNQEEWKRPLFDVHAKAPHEAVKAFSILLRGTPSVSNRQFLAALLLPKVAWSEGGVDHSQPVRLLNKSAFKAEKILAQGVAFNVGISDTPNELRASYLTNEVCMASRTLRYVGGKWRLVAMSEGCE